MNQHLGATYSLSVLLILMCAIAFYRPEKPADPARRPVGREEQIEIDPRPGPATEKQAANRVTDASARTIKPAQTESTSKPVALAEEKVGEVSRPNARQVSQARLGPRKAFVRAAPGETLADVAHRLYGSADKVDALWRANRDQLSAPEAPLTAGMLLRAP